jgi:hypothetical protein
MASAKEHAQDIYENILRLRVKLHDMPADQLVDIEDALEGISDDLSELMESINSGNV